MSEPLVKRIDAAQSPVSFEVQPFQKPKNGEKMSFESVVIVEPIPGTKFQKRGSLHLNLPTWSDWEVICDEGTAGGGTDTAPSPLGYLSLGIAFCLLTHLKENIDQLGLSVQSVKIEQKINFATTYNFAGTHPSENKASTDAMQTNIVLVTDEPAEKLKDLARWSEEACFAAQAVAQQTYTSLGVVINGERHSVTEFNS